jgi:hypothetical protein
MNPEWREQRLVLTAAIGAALGILLQNSFNVEIIGINVVLWAMAAAVCVVALGAGVPVGLNPAAIVRVAPVEESVPVEPPRRPHRRPARRSTVLAPLAIATVVVLGVSWFASTWWRADRSYQLAVEGSAALAQPDASSAEQTSALNSTLEAFRDASKQNSIESRYPLTEATFQLSVLAAANALNTDNVQALEQTKGLLQSAIDRAPRDPVPLSSYGRLLARLRELSPAAGEPELESELFLRASKANPYNIGYSSGAAQALYVLKDYDGARKVIDDALERSPSDKILLTWAVQIAKAQGDTAAADAYQARLDDIPAG